MTPMVILYFLNMALAFWAGYALATSRYKQKVEKFVEEHSYDSDDNPPGSL